MPGLWIRWIDIRENLLQNQTQIIFKYTSSATLMSINLQSNHLRLEEIVCVLVKQFLTLRYFPKVAELLNSYLSLC